MTQHFTASDFGNMTNLHIEGNTFGDRLTNSINFLADFMSFGLKTGVDSIQDMINSVSPSKQGSGNIRGPVFQNNPANDPVFIAQNPEEPQETFPTQEI